MKDLFTQAVTQEQIGVASIHKNIDGSGWFVYPNSGEPQQFTLLHGEKIVIEILAPDEGEAAFIRYYRGE